MQLRKLVDSPSGFRFMIDNLCTHSSYSRKLLLESSMMYDGIAIEKSYAVMKEFYRVVENVVPEPVEGTISGASTSSATVYLQTLQYKLCNLKDINNTISRP